MNRAQKMAWFMFIVMTVAIIIALLAVGIATYFYGFEKAKYGFAFLGLCGLGGLAPLFCKKDKGKVSFDERDRMIQRNAAWGGFAMCYLYFGIACMGIWKFLGHDAMISVRVLPWIFAGGGLVMFYVQSIAILIGYGRAVKNENG